MARHGTDGLFHALAHGGEEGENEVVHGQAGFPDELPEEFVLPEAPRSIFRKIHGFVTSLFELFRIYPEIQALSGGAISSSVR
jgi:hypothetical protein